MSNYLQPHGLQHARLPCPSPVPELAQTQVHRDGGAIQSFYALSSPFPLAFNLSQHVSFPVNQTFASGGQSIRVSVSASVLPMHIQDWFPLGLAGLISLVWYSKELSKVFSNKKIKSVTVSIVSSSIFHEMMGQDAMILVFWMLNFKPDFLLSSFTFIKRLFSSSLLSAIKVVSSAYLRLLILLLAILIPACASSSLIFHMMYSAYKLDKQSDNKQPWYTPFPIWNQFIVPCLVLTVASWPAYRFLSRQVWWFHLLKNFPVCCELHSQRVLCNQWSRSRCFSGILLLFQWSKGCWQFDLWFLCLL